jgi:hypothetical protein
MSDYIRLLSKCKISLNKIVDVNEMDLGSSEKVCCVYKEKIELTLLSLFNISHVAGMVSE